MRQLQLNRFVGTIGAFVVVMSAQLSHANQPAAPQLQMPMPMPMPQMQVPQVGYKLDKHGCNSAAGLSWCTKENACVQPWVLSDQRGFPKGSKAAFDAYCQAPAPAPASMMPPMVGSQRDAHGCIPSAGYSWCAQENACVQPWVLAAQKGFQKGSKPAFEAYCTGASQ